VKERLRLSSLKVVGVKWGFRGKKVKISEVQVAVIWTAK
jgi:hypothetical protein